MRVPLRRRQRGLRVNITPLIDVVFLLVIFFLVASHFARSEPTEPVDLPAATQTAADEHPRRLIITVLEDGTYLVGGREVTLDAIELMIVQGAQRDPQNYAVRLRGDRNAPYEWIEPIMLMCPRHGITDFGFNVLPR